MLYTPPLALQNICISISNLNTDCLRKKKERKKSEGIVFKNTNGNQVQV